MKEGTYRARAIEAVLGFTGQDHPQIAVAFRVEDGPSAGEVITWYGHFTEKTEKRTLESLRHCGWRGDDLSDLAGVGDEPVDIVVKLDTYEGKERLQVAWVNKPGSGGVALRARMTPEQAKAFARSMMGTVIAARGNGAPPPRRAPAPAPATDRVPFDDDEIPY